MRLHDNHGLYQAFNQDLPVLPVFIFDTWLLEKLSSPSDSRVIFIYEQIRSLKQKLEKTGSSMRVFHSSPVEAFEILLEEYEITRVYANKDYEPYALQRDLKLRELLLQRGIEFNLFKDQVIFEEDEIINNNQKPYTVFTPYCRKWKDQLKKEPPQYYPSEHLAKGFLQTDAFNMPSCSEMGFHYMDISFPSSEISEEIIRNYELTRNFPAIHGTSKLGVHLRYGTISIRELVIKAVKWSDVFLNELIWREFFFSVLWNFPYVVDKSFKTIYDKISWRNNEVEFKRWCDGETGFPLVDAGMRELIATGFMHNRVRMVAAGFLIRHLLVDWRWGEAWFAEKLLDYELASNNGNWQWAAGTGCDGAPWFRIFNPTIQQKKFDPKLEYIKRWVPEIGTKNYPSPVVGHEFARERALKAYKAVLRPFGYS